MTVASASEGVGAKPVCFAPIDDADMSVATTPAAVNAGDRARRKSSPLARREQLFAYALLAPAVIAVLALIAWPMYLLLSISFREGKSLNFLALSRRPFGFGNYESSAR